MTTVVGTVIIALSVYFFFFGAEEDWGAYFWHLIGAFVVGIVLLVMPDDIPAFVRQIANKFVFKNNNDKK